MHIQYIQSGNSSSVDISSHPFHMLISSRTKSLIAGSGQNDYAYIRTLPAYIHGIQNFGIRLRPESIINLRPVDGYLGYSLEILE